jgi:hypothetical protein
VLGEVRLPLGSVLPQEREQQLLAGMETERAQQVCGERPVRPREREDREAERSGG